MTEQKEPAPKKVEVKSEPKPAEKVQPKVQMIHTIFGRMVDPLTGEVYEQVPRELVKPSGWVTSQVESGKMAFTA